MTNAEPPPEPATHDAECGPTPIEDTRLFSTKEVARTFSRSERTIRNWVRQGLIRPLRVGRAVFFSRDELERIISGPDISNHKES
jgi:excisionase family DNA binding protein